MKPGSRAAAPQAVSSHPGQGPPDLLRAALPAEPDPALATAAKRMKVPLVNLWLNSPAQNLPGVFADFEASGIMAAEHLIGRGFKRFGYLGFLRDKDAGLQLTGFCNRLKREGLQCAAHRFSRASVTEKREGGKLSLMTLENGLIPGNRPSGSLWLTTSFAVT